MSETNNNTPMRITQLEEATAYEDGMFYAVAKAGGGTKKISQDVPNSSDFSIIQSLSAINNTFSLPESFWEFGGIGVSIGQYPTHVDNIIRIRTKQPIPIKTFNRIKLSVPTGYTFNLIFLDKDRKCLWQSSYVALQDKNITSDYPTAYYFLIVIAHGNADMETSECSNLTIEYKNANFKFAGYMADLGKTKIEALSEVGWYGFGAAYVSSITDLPSDYTNTAGYVEVRTPIFGNSSFKLFKLYDVDGNLWTKLYASSSVFRDWSLQYGALKGSGTYELLKNKNVAILGDSISTNGTDGDFPNVPEITVQSADVGVELKAYLTYYDVQGGLSLGGHTFTSDEIGTEVTFTPTNDDIGKKIGVPNNYNPASTVVWWEVMKEQLGFNPIPACWSGSSITSHEGNTAQYKTSYAWHEAQIRKCGIRTAGTMNRTAPDVVFIYRGTNDFSHSPYTLLTDNYFDNYNWTYPENDSVSGGYGYKEGLCLTIKKIRDAYPNAKIFLCTLNVFKRVNYSHFPTNNGINSLPQYNDAIREVADFMGCGVINFDQDGITFENCYSQGYITDSATIPTHPSNKGHKAMGLKAIADIKAQYSNMT